MLKFTNHRPVFAGWDQSLNHGALVALDREGKIIFQSVLSTTKKDVQKQGAAMIPEVITSLEDGPSKAVRRLDWLKSWFQRSLHSLSAAAGKCDLYMAVEDYAFAQARGAHQLGEVGGILRVVVASFAQLRLHDPSTVKVFAAGKGNATKTEVIAGVKNRWEFTPPPFATAVREDFCDAYTLARMILLEWEVRTGAKKLEELAAEDRQIFLRVTKNTPVNLLGRPFIRLEME